MNNTVITFLTDGERKNLIVSLINKKRIIERKLDNLSAESNCSECIYLSETLPGHRNNAFICKERTNFIHGTFKLEKEQLSLTNDCIHFKK